MSSVVVVKLAGILADTGVDSPPIAACSKSA
jgi:hypothetical protein